MCRLSIMKSRWLAILASPVPGTFMVASIICNGFKRPLTVSADEPHTHQTVCFAFDADLLPFTLPLLIRDSDGSSTCRFLIDKIIRTRLSSNKNNLKLSGLFLQLLGELQTLSADSSQVGSPSERRHVERAKKYVYEHISEPIVQKEIADHLDVTPQYLCAVFKKIEGSSLIHFVNEIKLAHIKDLMENKNLSLSQASMQLGFSDPNYVSKLYKKYYHENISQTIDRSK